jgi:hypothetical protein
VKPKEAITVSGSDSWFGGMYKRPDGWWVDGTDPRDKGRDPYKRWLEGDLEDPMFDFDDDRHCWTTPYTGNDGATNQRWYYAAAIVFRPA